MNALMIYRIGHWCYERGIPVVPQLAYEGLFHILAPEYKAIEFFVGLVK